MGYSLARSQNSSAGTSSCPNGLALDAKREKCLQVEWRKVPSEDVSSRASPEVLGAVDLLSLKRATWGKAAPFQTRLRVSTHPDSDYGCPATLGDASVAWCSDNYLHASSPLNDSGLLPGRNDAISSTSGGRCCMKNIHTPLRSKSQCAVPHWHPQKLSRQPTRAECILTSNRSSLQHKTKGHGRDPACIKEWAALTTWLRMNLHQARTAKRQVCFVGRKSHELGRWVFSLNPNLPWSEVSRETKQRSLPNEAEEQAFVHKYPVRDPSGWQDKALKYKPGCSSDAYDIAMGPLVSDLHTLYLKHEVHSRRSLHM
ncbi:TPA: hypothetical protein ACH3X1_007276 [Trebouxia sp. C0004]